MQHCAKRHFPSSASHAVDGDKARKAYSAHCQVNDPIIGEYTMRHCNDDRNGQN